MRAGGTPAAPAGDDAPPPTLPLTSLPEGDGNAAPSAAEGGNETPATPPADGDSNAANAQDPGADAADPADSGESAPTPPPSTPAAPGADFIVPGPGEGVQTRGITDPAVLDLKAVPLLAKFKETSDEEFADLTEDLELYLEDSGAQSNRAGNRLVDAGRAAFPIIINAMMQLDYATQEGNYTGGTLNQLLYRAGNENKNYSWKTTQLFELGSTEFNDAALWNKKVVGSLQRLWVEQLAENDEAWERYVTKSPPKEDGGE